MLPGHPCADVNHMLCYWLLNSSGGNYSVSTASGHVMQYAVQKAPQN